MTFLLVTKLLLLVQIFLLGLPTAPSASPLAPVMIEIQNLCSIEF